MKKKYNIQINSLAPIVLEALRGESCKKCGCWFTDDDPRMKLCEGCAEELTVMYLPNLVHCGLGKQREIAKSVIANKPKRNKENIRWWAEGVADTWNAFTD